MYTPDGTKVREWKGDEVFEPGGVRLSPDGKTLGVLRPYETRTLNRDVNVGGAALAGTFSRSLFRVTIYPVAEKLTGTDVSLPGDSVETVLWSADGSKLYAATHADDENHSHDINLKHYVFDLASRSHSELKPPAGHHLKAVSPDGKVLLTKGPAAKPAEAQRVFLVPAAGGEAVALNGPNEVFYDGQFSPDGTRVVIGGFKAGELPMPQPGEAAAPPPVTPEVGGWLVTLPVNDPKKRTELPLKKREYAKQCGWSPDGKRVVSTRQVLPELNQPPAQMEVVVTDASGRDPKVVTRDTGRYLEPVFIDWR
jgi:Tol biopolymer transport system component